MRYGENMIIRRKAFVIFVAICFVTLAVARHTPASQKPAPSSAAQSHGAPPSDASYRIGPLDVLNIDIWKEPNISRTVPVRPDGKISLPLLNDMQAGGLTPMELSSNITQALAKFITDPQVTIIVTEMNSQRVYIMGQVMRAGAYPLLPQMTVLQALSSAGGFSQFANVKKIYVLRRQEGNETKIHFNYKQVVDGNHPEEDVVLQGGDTVVVP
jgi:polysaccharide export outer membrane protein